MTNSQRFYHYAKAFQDARQKAKEEYQQTAESMKRYSGSEYFRTEMKKAKEKLDASIQQAKDYYSPYLMDAIRSMKEQNDKRSVKAPTQDQLAILSALKMRDKISSEELKQAANAMMDCPVAFDVIREIAQKNGVYVRMPETNTYSIDSVSDILKTLHTNTVDFIQSEFSPASRRQAEIRQNLYGGTAPLSERQLFDDVDGCFYELLGLKDKSLQAFIDAVDGVDDVS